MLRIIFTILECVVCQKFGKTKRTIYKDKIIKTGLQLNSIWKKGCTNQIIFFVFNRLSKKLLCMLTSFISALKMFQ